MFTVRRHLGRGANFMHYQIRGHVTDAKQGAVVEYVNPDTHSIVFKGCRLHNKVNTSKKIFEGDHKSPCAWLICESYEVIPKSTVISTDIHLRFNPKVSPHWNTEENDNVDNDSFDTVTMKEAKLFI